MQVAQGYHDLMIPVDKTRWVKWFHHWVKTPQRDWEWGYVHVRPAVAIVALNKDTHLALVSQFRYPLGKELEEIPKGFVEDGEEPLAAAIRELKEEVGMSAGEWQSLGEIIAAPGVGKIIHHIFLALELAELTPDQYTPPQGDTLRDPLEKLRVEWLDLDRFFQRVVQGSVIDAVTIAAVAKVRLYFRSSEK